MYGQELLTAAIRQEAPYGAQCPQVSLEVNWSWSSDQQQLGMKYIMEYKLFQFFPLPFQWQSMETRHSRQIRVQTSFQIQLTIRTACVILPMHLDIYWLWILCSKHHPTLRYSNQATACTKLDISKKICYFPTSPFPFHKCYVWDTHCQINSGSAHGT